MKFKRVDTTNGLWRELYQSWEDEAADFGENLSEYASASMSVLSDLAHEAPTKRAGVFAVTQGDSTFSGMCQLNVSFLPGYQGQVLRVRHITHSPQFDFDEAKTVEDYATFLTQILSGVLATSLTEMPAPHIKFHFRSPAERAFFSMLQDVLKDFDEFKSVEMRGAWLYITKTEAPVS